jgi:hypothetical protein
MVRNLYSSGTKIEHRTTVSDGDSRCDARQHRGQDQQSHPRDCNIHDSLGPHAPATPLHRQPAALPADRPFCTL